MKKVFLIILLCLSKYGYGQVTWKENIVKTGKDSYQLHLTAAIEPPWHIYSENLSPGGPIATNVTFDNSKGVSFIGKVTENGKLIIRHESAFGMDVKYFENEVDFIQSIRVLDLQIKRLTGQVEFMLCDNNRCLPPTAIKFTFSLP